jgi:hypothetical protein
VQGEPRQCVAEAHSRSEACVRTLDAIEAEHVAEVPWRKVNPGLPAPPPGIGADVIEIPRLQLRRHRAQVLPPLLEAIDAVTRRQREPARQGNERVGIGHRGSRPLRFRRVGCGGEGAIRLFAHHVAGRPAVDLVASESRDGAHGRPSVRGERSPHLNFQPLSTGEPVSPIDLRVLELEEGDRLDGRARETLERASRPIAYDPPAHADDRQPLGVHVDVAREELGPPLESGLRLHVDPHDVHRTPTKVEHRDGVATAVSVVGRPVLRERMNGKHRLLLLGPPLPRLRRRVVGEEQRHAVAVEYRHHPRLPEHVERREPWPGGLDSVADHHLLEGAGTQPVDATLDLLDLGRELGCVLVAHHDCNFGLHARPVRPQLGGRLAVGDDHPCHEIAQRWCAVSGVR